MRKYLYTVQVNFEAHDDIDARKKAKEVEEKLAGVNGKRKLQEIRNGQEPRKINFNI